MYFFFNDTATTEIYTLSLHDALPIWKVPLAVRQDQLAHVRVALVPPPRLMVAERPDRRQWPAAGQRGVRSEEHTSELQSRQYLVCRLLLEKKQIILSTIINNDRIEEF